MKALTDERDAVAAEHDSLISKLVRRRGLVDTRSTHVSKLSENLESMAEELSQTCRRATLRWDQLIHQSQLTHWKWTHFSIFQDEYPAAHAHHV